MAKVQTINRSGLVGEWLLDGNAFDTSGNGNNGTATNVTYVDTDRGYQRQTGVFDGGSSYLEIPTSSSIEFGTNDFTISYWLNPTDITIYKQPVGKYSSSNNGGWATQMGTTSSSSGTVYMREAGTSNETSFETAENYWIAGSFHLYTFVIKSSSVDFYRDGILFQSVSGTRRNISNTSAPVRIMRSYASDYLSGRNQTIRLFSRALSTQEIDTLYKEGLRKLAGAGLAPLTDGLVAYYDFNGDANDIIGGFNGTVTGATLTTDRFGNANRAYSFDGTNGKQITYPSVGISGNVDFSISVWAYFSDNDYSNVFGLGGASVNNAIGIYKFISPDATRANKIGASFYGGGSAFVGPTATLNTWYNITITLSSVTDKITLYVDGVSYGESTSTAYNISGTSANVFGKNQQGTGSDYWNMNGKIGETCIYNRALSASEVLALYNLSKNRYITPLLH